MDEKNKQIIKEVDRIILPDSKSILNRILLIEKIIGYKRPLDLEYQCTDVQVMYDALWNEDLNLDIRDAGTPYRFLTAYFAAIGEPKTLNCSDGMAQRPMKHLTDVLNALGAEITYKEKEGYPPLSINGKIQFESKIALDASLSSQFLSALMLVAPLANQDITIVVSSEIPSWPYVLLTAELMIHYGIDVKMCEDEITILNGNYQTPTEPINIEKDWTAASYFYAISALTGKEFILENLLLSSIQGDKITLTIFEKFGVKSIQKKNNMHLMHDISSLNLPVSLNFEDHPDLAPTFIVLCSILGLDMKFYGLNNLKHKESNRTLALKEELSKFGVLFEEHREYWELNTSKLEFPETISLNTYEDHRIAMALSLFMWVTNVRFDKPEVVKKSFPNFWNELLKLTLPEDE